MGNPNFFIVGAPKSGTTALYTYLREHPDIFLPELKEPHFFGSDLLHINRPPRSLQRYLSHFSQSQGAKRIGDASTSYLYSSLAPSEIYEVFGTPKIIIMLRRPVDVSYAMHSENVHAGFEYITSFEAALDAEADRKRGLLWPNRPGIVNYLFYRDIARYTENIRRYIDFFGAKNVHIILFDDFQKDTNLVYREVLRFLDVYDDFQPTIRRINSNKQVRSRRAQSFLLTPPAYIKGIANAMLSNELRQSISTRLSLINTTYKPRPPLQPELRERLQADFSSDIEALGMFLGRDLTHWTVSKEEDRA